MSAYASVNPATGETLQEFDLLDDARVQSALARTHAGYAAWRAVDVDQRAQVMLRAAELYLERIDELARTTSLEMGKPLREARGEISLSAAIYQYHGQNGPGFLPTSRWTSPEPTRSCAASRSACCSGSCRGTSRTTRSPDSPAPTSIGQHHPAEARAAMSESALPIEQIFRDAGLPTDAYVNVFATNEQVATIIADPRMQGVSLTGSERAGAAVAETAGRHLKKAVLELGGSDPFIVLDAPYLDATVPAAAGQARLVQRRAGLQRGRSGSSSSSTLRRVRGRGFTAFEASLPPATRWRRGTYLRPARPPPGRSRPSIDQVEAAVARGREGAHRRHAACGPGACVRPRRSWPASPRTCAPTARLSDRSAVIYRVPTRTRRSQLANLSPFGLGGSVWSDDEDRVARRGPPRGGNGVRNEHPAPRCGPALRRGQALRLRPRAWTYGMEEFVNNWCGCRTAEPRAPGRSGDHQPDRPGAQPAAHSTLVNVPMMNRSAAPGWRRSG